MPHYCSEFAAEAGAGTAARRELETLGWTLDSEESSVVALLVTELITNSVQHAAPRSGGSVGLEVDVSDALVGVRVTDSGSGFTAPFRTDDSPLDAGWGLYLLDELSDRWEVTAEPSTVVAFELDRARNVLAPRTVVEDDDERLARALTEQARLGDAYQRAVGTSAEMPTFIRLEAASREVAAADAATRTG